MANAFGLIVGAKIIQRALQLTFLRPPLLRTFSMGFKELDGSIAGAVLGQDVSSRILTVSPVTNFGTPPSDFAMVDVLGKLRNFRQIYHKFTAAEINTTDLRLIDQNAEPMAVGLSNEIVRAMAAMVSRYNFNTTVNGKAPYLSVAASWTYLNTLLPFTGLLDDRATPQENRYLLTASPVNIALLGDAALYSALNSPQNAEVVKLGRLPAIVTGLAYDRFPALVPSDSNLIGFGGTPDALIYMGRAPKSPDEVFAAAGLRAPFSWSIMTDDNSGFSVLVQQWMDTDMSVHTRLAWLDGYSVGNPANLVRLINGVVVGAAGTIVSAKVTNPGYGYRNATNVFTAPDVALTGGVGSGATATAQIDTVGAITGITIATPGTGYTGTPSIAITPVAGGRCDAPGTASVTVAGLN